MIEQASLVIGNGNFAVKENSFLGYALNQNLYVPREMDVVRATTATLVNSDGLIEEVPYNLLQRSEEFNNSYWTKLNATITANSVNSPIGTLTADSFTESTDVVASNHQISLSSTTFPVVTGSSYTLSFFVKSNSTRSFRCAFSSGAFGSNDAFFDVQNKVVLSQTGGTATITELTNNWVRVTFTATATATTTTNIFLGSANGTTRDYIGTGTLAFYLWGAQLVQGSTPKTYFPTTDRLDVPRVDYSNGTPSILVEPQRTNLLTNSDGNLATYTTSSNVTNATNSFNTFANAIQFGDNSLSRLAYKRNFTPTIGTQYTISVFVQMDDNSLPVLGITSTTGDFGLIINANLATLNPKVEQLGTTNIYRVSVSRIADSTNTQFGVIKYITQSAKGFRITGIQLEVGSNSTSYISTVASTVTRNADVISKTGISSLIGQTEGTIFTEFNFTNVGTEKYILNLKDAASSNVISFRRLTSGEIRFVLTATTSSGTTNQSTAVLPNGNYKIAYKYISGSIKIFINGSLSFTLNPTFTFGTPISIIELGNQNAGNQINDSIKQLQLYKTALTDQECINLTTI
jgi:hypothetical protein